MLERKAIREKRYGELGKVLNKKVVFEKRTEGHERESLMDVWAKSVQEKEPAPTP